MDRPLVKFPGNIPVRRHLHLTGTTPRGPPQSPGSVPVLEVGSGTEEGDTT